MTHRQRCKEIAAIIPTLSRTAQSTSRLARKLQQIENRYHQFHTYHKESRPHTPPVEWQQYTSGSAADALYDTAWIHDLHRVVYPPEQASKFFGVPEDVFRIPREPANHNRRKARNIAERVADQLSASGIKARTRELITRTTIALHMAELQGRVAMFVTLTVKDDYYADFKDHGGVYWNRHRTSLKKVLGPNMEFISIQEPGAKTGRHHIHAIITTDRLPLHTQKDPKGGYPKSEHRELQPPITWKYGIEQWIPIRYHQADNWARKYRHSWPIKNAQPIQRSLPIAIGRYISKYLSKCRPQENRTRYSRAFGLKPIQEYLRNNNLLRKASHNPRHYSQTLGITTQTLSRLIAQQCARVSGEEVFALNASTTRKRDSPVHLAKWVQTRSSYIRASSGHSRNRDAVFRAMEAITEAAAQLNERIKIECHNQISKVDKYQILAAIR